jgi:hypothetical protein
MRKLSFRRFAMLYLAHLYFAVTTLTGLGKDIKPASAVELAFVLVVFAIGRRQRLADAAVESAAPLASIE